MLCISCYVFVNMNLNLVVNAFIHSFIQIWLLLVQTIRDVGYSFFKKSLLAAASDDGSLTLWDTNTNKLVTSFGDAHNAPTTALSFSPLNNLLLASSGLDKRVVCYDVNGKR